MLLSKERELREYKPWQNPPVKLMNMSGFALVKPPINLYNFVFLYSLFIVDSILFLRSVNHIVFLFDSFFTFFNEIKTVSLYCKLLFTFSKNSKLVI